MRSRTGLPPMPGNGARKAWPAAAPRAVPMMASVAGLIGPTPFLEGSMARERPQEGGGRCANTPAPEPVPGPWTGGVAPVPVSAARAALTDPAAKAQDVAVSWPTP